MIDHKSTYDLGPVEIQIEKQYENNLRERNPQLGRVEASCGELSVGDIVAVNHFVFYGDVGPDKSFTLQPNCGGLFRANDRQIFFKYNNGVPEPLNDYILCEWVIEQEEHFGVYFGERKYIRCTHGEYAGSDILTLPHAMYMVTLDKVDYYKVRKDEVVCVDGRLREGYSYIEYLPEKESLIWGAKKPNTLLALCHEGVYNGETLLVYRNQGVSFRNGFIIDDEMIVGELV